MAAKKKVQQEFYGDVPDTLDEHPFYGFTLDEQQKEFAEAILNMPKRIMKHTC